MGGIELEPSGAESSRDETTSRAAWLEKKRRKRKGKNRKGGRRTLFPLACRMVSASRGSGPVIRTVAPVFHAPFNDSLEDARIRVYRSDARPRDSLGSSWSFLPEISRGPFRLENAKFGLAPDACSFRRRSTAAPPSKHD